MTTRHLNRLVAASVAALLAAAGCGAPGATGDDAIVIGVVSGRSGFMSIFDAPALTGLQIKVEQVNAAGGIGGRPLRLVTADHRSDVGQIVPAALQVLDQGAEVVVTSCDYDFGGPAAREAEAAGRVAIGCAGAPLFGAQGVGPLTFNAYSGTASEGAAMATLARDQGFGTAYLLEDTSIEYSSSVCEYFEQAWTAAGGTVVGSDTFGNADPSIASQVTRLVGTPADVVALCSYPPGGAAAVRQIRGSTDVPIVAPGAFDGSYWLEGIPELSGFSHLALGSIAGDDPDPDRTRFFADYTAAAGQPPASSVYPVMGYTIGEMIVGALEATGGDSDGPVLAEAIVAADGSALLAGPTSYTAQCHIPVERPWTAMVIEAGTPAYRGEVTPTAVPPAPC